MPIETVTEARMPGIGRPVARGYIDHLNETHRKRSVRGRAQAASAGGVDRLPVWKTAWKSDPALGVISIE